MLKVAPDIQYSLVLESLQAKPPGVASEVLRRMMHQGQRQDPLLLDQRAAPRSYFYRQGGGFFTKDHQ